MLINLNDVEVKFVLLAVQEAVQKLEAKLMEKKPVVAVQTTTVRMTKAGRPAKKPGRKPGKKPVVKLAVEQAA